MLLPRITNIRSTVSRWLPVSKTLRHCQPSRLSLTAQLPTLPHTLHRNLHITAVMHTVNKTAASGFDDHSKNAYESGRPTWTNIVIDHIIDSVIEPRLKSVKSGDKLQIVDLGAGTGKFTFPFVTRMQERQLLDKVRIQAVDPVKGMANKFNELATKHGVEVKCAIGTADDLELPASSVDVIIAAQAFHWFSTPSALKGIAHVLRSNGAFVWCWNGRGVYSDLSNKVSAVLERYHSDDVPRHDTGNWKAVFDDQPYFQTPYNHWHADKTTETRGGEQMVIDRILSTSMIACLPDDEKQRIIDEVHQMLANDPETAGGKELVIPYNTDVYYAVVKK